MNKTSVMIVVETSDKRSNDRIGNLGIDDFDMDHHNVHCTLESMVFVIGKDQRMKVKVKVKKIVSWKRNLYYEQYTNNQ